MDKIFKLPMKLQFFADPEGEPDTGAQEEGEPKTFTQEDVDKLIADRVKRESNKAAKAQTALQAQLDELTDKLNNAGKTQEEQATAELDALRGNLTAKEEELANAKAELEALKQGVSADKLDKVIKLAKLSEEEDIETAIAGVLDEFPMFKGEDPKQEEVKKPNFAKDGNPGASGGSMTKTDFMRMGYKERAELKRANPNLYDQLK